MENRTCIVCCERITFFAVGKCNHREVCHVCSFKMRTLYKSDSCSFCKESLPQVFFTEDETTPFENLNRRPFVQDHINKGVLYQSKDLKESCQNLLKFTCPVQDCRKISRSLKEAKEHIAAEHSNLHLCGVCIGNRKIFFHEHKLYTKSDMISHIRKGDKDDSSFKGHPLCQFCIKPFYSQDELYEHLELKHEHCFICRKNGKFDQYFSDYQNLEDHFRKDHFLCEEPECRMKAFVVFRNEIDLHLHMNDIHQRKKNQKILIEIPSQTRGRFNNENRTRTLRSHDRNNHSTESPSRPVQLVHTHSAIHEPPVASIPSPPGPAAIVPNTNLNINNKIVSSSDSIKEVPKEKSNIKSRVPQGFGLLSQVKETPTPSASSSSSSLTTFSAAASFATSRDLPQISTVEKKEDFPSLSSSSRPVKTAINSPYKSAITKAPQNSKDLTSSNSFPSLPPSTETKWHALPSSYDRKQKKKVNA